MNACAPCSASIPVPSEGDKRELTKRSTTAVSTEPASCQRRGLGATRCEAAPGSTPLPSRQADLLKAVLCSQPHLPGHLPAFSPEDVLGRRGISDPAQGLCRHLVFASTPVCRRKGEEGLPCSLTLPPGLSGTAFPIVPTTPPASPSPSLTPSLTPSPSPSSPPGAPKSGLTIWAGLGRRRRGRQLCLLRSH